METITLETYQQQVTHLEKRQDWHGLMHYCRRIEQQIRHRMQEGETSEEEQRLRIQALMDLQTAYLLLERPQKRLWAAQEAHRAWKQLPSAPDPLHDYYSYTSLAHAYAAYDQVEKAREMMLRAGVSQITRGQAEWLGNALLELSALEQAVGNSQKAVTLVELAEGIKRASQKVEKGRNKTP